MNAREVCHLWANQSRAKAKAGSVFFEGPSIYSYGYHFEMARLVKLEDSGREIVLINPHKYSVTTSKHQSYVMGAIALPREQRYRICGAWCSWERIKTEADLAAAIQSWAKEEAENEELAKQRKRDAAKRRRDEAKAKRASLSEWPEKLKEWKQGGALPRLWQQFPAALRVNGDRIETTKGAKVPASVARKAWPYLRRAVESEERAPCGFAWNPFFSLPDFRWGDYTGIALRRIALGSPVELVVGCHQIPWREVEEIAEALGLIETAAA